MKTLTTAFLALIGAFILIIALQVCVEAYHAMKDRIEVERIER